MPRSVPSLRRSGPTRKAKKKFLLFCEGERTEPDYFRALARLGEFSLVEIVTVAAAGVPSTIADKAVQKARQRKRDSFEKDDEVWAIFDRDEHPKYDESIAKCAAANVGVARSDPCFEVWLILHYAEFDRPDDRHQVQAHLEGLCHGYDRRKRKTADFSTALGNLEQAEARAERQLKSRQDEGAPYSAPSTTVFELTRRLRSKT